MFLFTLSKIVEFFESVIIAFEQLHGYTKASRMTCVQILDVNESRQKMANLEYRICYSGRTVHCQQDERAKYTQLSLSLF